MSLVQMIANTIGDYRLAVSVVAGGSLFVCSDSRLYLQLYPGESFKDPIASHPYLISVCVEHLSKHGVRIKFGNQRSTLVTPEYCLNELSVPAVEIKISLIDMSFRHHA